jgi:hypothetical protein
VTRQSDVSYLHLEVNKKGGIGVNMILCVPHWLAPYRRQIYVVYVSLNGRHARFAMPAMCGASAVEITQLLINSHYFGCF